MGVCSARAADTKFIELGWDMPDTTFLRAHWREMEEEGPFDGVIFRVEAATEDGRKVSTQAGWKPPISEGAITDMPTEPT